MNAERGTLIAALIVGAAIQAAPAMGVSNERE
jgi:hypothetical protein